MKRVKKVKYLLLLWRDDPASELLGIYTSRKKALRAMARIDPTVVGHPIDEDSMGNLATGLWRVTALKVNPKHDRKH